MVLGSRVRRRRDGRYSLRLGAEERALLRQLPTEAKALVEGHDPSTFRLFPVAYPGDVEAEADYRALVGVELVKRHSDALDVLAATAGANDLGEDELQGWLGALEVLRLVVGTRLNVNEEGEADAPAAAPGDPTATQVALYRYLSWLQGEIVDALASGLPAGGHS